MNKIKKQILIRQKKEYKTIKDGSKICDEIKFALKADNNVFGLTMGAISLIQIVELICKEFGGKFDLGTCVWSANQVDIYRLGFLRKEGFINDIKFLIDPSTYSRKYDAVRSMYDVFGIENIRTIPTHAKFVTLKNEKHSFSIISSMNFTHNPRIEQYQIINCTDTLEYLNQMITESFEKYAPEDNFTGESLSKFHKIRAFLKSKEKTEEIPELDFLKSLPEIDLDKEFELLQ